LMAAPLAVPVAAAPLQALPAAERTELARVARPDAPAKALLPAVAAESAEDTTLGERPRSGFSCQLYSATAAAAASSRAQARSTFHVFSPVRACWK
jgi:hypothetical protein